MPDIFDQITSQKDVFDNITQPKKKEDIFDTLSSKDIFDEITDKSSVKPIITEQPYKAPVGIPEKQIIPSFFTREKNNFGTNIKTGIRRTLFLDELEQGVHALRSVGETGVALAGGVLGWLTGKTATAVVGIAKGGDKKAMEEALETGEKVAQWWQIAPTEKAGQEATEIIGKVLQTVLTPIIETAKEAGKITEATLEDHPLLPEKIQKLAPWLGYLAEFGGELAMFKGTHAAGKKVKAAVTSKAKAKVIIDKIEKGEMPLPEDAGLESGALGFQPKGNFAKRLFSKDKAPELAKRSQIVKDLSEMLDVPIRVGKFRQKALGIYKIKPEVIRSKAALDIETISHEVGHHLHKTVFKGATKKGLSGKTFKEFADELNPIASKPSAGQPKSPEGFAEFIRRYITNDIEAKKVAPRFYKYFDETLTNQYPEVREILLKARKDYTRWSEQPATAKILSHISIEEKASKGIKAGDIYTSVVDDLNPLKVAVNEMVKGQELAFSENPYILARMIRGKWGKIDSFLENAPFDYRTLKPLEGVKPLNSILKPIEKDLNNFRVYITAKRAIELQRKRKKTGIDLKDARQAIKEIENVKFKDAFKELEAYQDSVLNYLLDSEVLSPVAYLKIKAAHKNYVPFYRVVETEGGGTGKGFANLFSPVKRLKGSTREIIDPLESIIKNTYAFIDIAERNAVGLKLVKLAEKIEGGGKYAERIPTPIKSVAITNKELYKIFDDYANWKETKTFQKFKKEFTAKTGIKEGEISKPIEKMEGIIRDSLVRRGMTEGEANVFIHKLKGAKTSTEINNVVETIIEKETIIHTVKELDLDLPEIVNIFRPSKMIPKDAPIITVFRLGKPVYYELSSDLFRTMNALDRESVSMLTNFLSKPARLLRAGATLAPEFSLRNPLRDQFMAFIQSKYGYTPGVDFTRGLFHALKKDELYWDFKRSGAEHSMLVSLDRQYLQRNLKDIMSGRNPFVPEAINVTTIKHPVEVLRIFSEFGETATRLGEFRKALIKEGRTREGLTKAGFASREVTIDFARLGAKTQAMNMITAFWNARLQGLDKIVRTFKENPTQTTAKTIASITIPSILLHLANKDDPRYKEMARWQKDMFWIVLTDKHIYRIPKPFELGILFGSFPERVMEYMEKKDPAVFKDWVGSFWEGAKPGILPTVSVPLVENYGNWSMFTDRPIVPRAAEELEPGFQTAGYTSEFTKKIGEAINYSPAKIENLIRGYTGGLGMLGIKAIDEIFRKTGVVDLPPLPKRGLADIPGIRGFIVRYPTSNTQSIENFYRQYAKSRRFVSTYKFLEKSGRSKEADKYYLKHQRNIELSGALNDVARGFSGFHQLIQGIYNNKEMNPEDKRKALDEVYLEMIEIAKEVNREINMY